MMLTFLSSSIIVFVKPRDLDFRIKSLNVSQCPINEIFPSTS